MRFLGVVAAALLSVAGVVATADPAAAISPTVKVVVRPVTSSGHLATGFTLSPGSAVVDCSVADPSPVSVSPNVEECSPTVLYPVACWKAALAHHVLCLENPRQHMVTRFALTSSFAPTPRVSALERAPFVVRLGDGDLCQIRIGGAYPPLPGHPNLSVSYTCAKDGAIWAGDNAPHHGINESHPVWTLRTAQFTSHTLVTRHVVKAWFVGTAP